MRSRRDPTKEIAGWRLGINSVSPETDLRKDELRDATNVDLSDSGKPRRRTGFTKIYTGTDIHSLYKHGDNYYFVEGSALKRLLPDNTAASVVAGLLSTARMSYDVVNSRVYYSNGLDKGVIQEDGQPTEWGVPAPESPPLLTVESGGALPAGKHMFCTTQVNSTGEESAPSYHATATVSGTEKITITIPASSYDTRIFATSRGGDTFRLMHTLAAGETTFVVTGSWSPGYELETLDTADMPAGRIVRYHRGRMWVAADNVVWFSEPLRFGLLRPADNFFLYSASVDVMEPVEDGMYIAADRTYFVSTDSEKPRQRYISDDTGVFGTGASTTSDAFGIKELQGEVAYWMGSEGLIIGGSGGQMLDVTRDRVAIPVYEQGSTFFRQVNGIKQAVTAVRTPGPASSLQAADTAEAVIRRNGVIIG